MAEINAAIPMSYQYGPTIGEHFKSAMTLADMMDQRKQRALEMQATQQTMAQNQQLYPLQVQAAQQGLATGAQNLATAQQTYQQNERTNPLTYEKMQEEHKDLLQKRRNENLEIMAHAAETVIDESSYQAWKRFADTEVGGDTTDLPATYDDNAKLHVDNVIKGYSAKKQQESDFLTKYGMLNSIAAMPDGPEKMQKFSQFMLSTAPAAYYPTSSTGIESAVNKIKATATPTAQAVGQATYAKTVAEEATSGGQLDIEKERVAAEKAKREEAAAAAKTKEGESNAEQYTANTLSKIENLISDIESGKTRTGMTADAWAKYITSSNAATQKAYFDQIKNSLTVQKLLDIKAQGGTFGALSEKELELLTKSASNLDFAGSKERNLAALKEIKNTIEAAKVRKFGTQNAGKQSGVDLNRFWK